MANRYVAKGTTDLSTVGIANNDSVYFLEGEQTVTAGMNLSALLTPVDIIFGPSFAGYVPDLQCDLSGVLRYEAGGGAVGLIVDGTTTEIVAKVEHVGAGLLTAKTSGTITEWQQASGRGVIQDSVIATNIRMNGGDLTQYYKSTLNTGWTISGGTFKTGRGFTGTADITGGNVIVRREDSSATLPTGVTLNISGPAKVKWAGGNITTLNLLHPEAMVDFTEIPAAITITSMTGFAKAIYRAGLPTGAGATATMKSGFAVTLTNAATQYVGKSSQYAIGQGYPSHD